VQLIGQTHLIINGKVPHAVLIELFTKHGAGTLIEKD
jgi:acetylglutamate kinase